ncbi:MAG: hypothetical protein WHT26_09155 [Thermus sp.]|jgi:hypothetical protein|nr:hypothetical protein [Thermus oshimai]
MQKVVQDLSAFVKSQGWTIRLQKVDEDGDGIVAFSPKDGFNLTLMVSPEQDGLFFYILGGAYSSKEFAGLSLEALALAVTSKIKAAKCFTDNDGDLHFRIEGFTHDPATLPPILPRLVKVLDDATDIAAAFRLFRGLLGR